MANGMKHPASTLPSSDRPAPLGRCVSGFSPWTAFRAWTTRDFVATDLEVVTVTATGTEISWITREPLTVSGIPAPVFTDTRVWLAPIGQSLELVHDDPTPRAFHHVVLDDLEPGLTYQFKVSSNGRQPSSSLIGTAQRRSPETTYRFTTLVPPPGRFLGTLAMINDVHIGERRQGIVLGPLPTSVPQTKGEMDYPRLMLGAGLDQLQQRHETPYLLVGGDITCDSLPAQCRLARTMLDAYGPMTSRWLAVRGNHDRPRMSPLHASGTQLAQPLGHYDPWGDEFVPYQQTQSVTLDGGLRIVGIDTTRASAGGRINAAQMDHLEQILGEDPHRPTIVMTHHPVTRDSAWSHPSGPQFMLRQPDRRKLMQLEAHTPGIFFHYSGHTHRARRSKGDLPGMQIDFLENPAISSYPGGYGLIHLYEGGYQVNFHRVLSPPALRWTYRSRWGALGIAPHWTMGHLGDRSFVRHVDLSGLQPIKLG